jgi:serine/threonine-protein kinase
MPVPVRAAYAVAAVAVIIGIASFAWKLGLRDLVLAKSPAAAAGAVAPTSAPVIAVMPFKNLSSEPDSDYFVDGLTSEVINNLTEIEGLGVKSQTSSFFFKDRPRDLQTIGEQLGVNLIVEADVQRVGRRLRINAQLVQIAGDVPLWSETFDETLDDVFAIQDEISRAIVDKLRLTLGRGQRRYQTNLEAYQLYLKARAVRAGRGEGRGLEEAIKLFEQVIAIDPAFAPAYAGLATARQSMVWNIFPGGFEGVRAAAIKARTLDPMLAEAEVAMGVTYAYEHDWENATESFDRALGLNPNLTQIHTNYSDALVLMGQPERGLQLLEQAIIMDPLSLTVRRDLAFAQFLNGRFEDAIANVRQVVAADPEFMSDLVEGRALTQAGRPEEAIAVWKSRPVNRGWERWLARAYLMTGRKKEMERLVAAHRNETPYHQAIIYAGLGDKDRTFEALNEAADAEPLRTAAILFGPEMKFLLGDPRRDALKKKLKLP